ncbi:conserved protein of unknown function [Pseudodesulfovibrio profundus]|uniref:Capsule polysaccharide biosynthesis protein n=1 Tax=Pseudodesulfovibrio profundus TaxID=57320 RepID=A0A2C8FC85_9BACT|nr:capsular biosynthesis protein [Pseudodesulfovibrio profundus]SOB60061.1 conserved protein of unknown function [Pseudodesulfovibrio profundus]
MDTQRSFLLLQGPQSRFFKWLGEALVAAGHRVAKVNFCGGDVFSWPWSHTRIFNKPKSKWAAHVRSLIDELGVTDLLLFGDRRQFHAEAISVARGAGVRVYVFEEGYLQPDCITFEENGVNAASRIPRTAEGIRELGEKLPPLPRLPVVGNSLKRRVLDTVLHHVGNTVLWCVFPFYRTHRPYIIGRELMGWIPRYYRRVERATKAVAKQEALLSDGTPFFLYPLQLDSDFQMRLNSSFTDVPDAIRNVMASFAAGAPSEAKLVIKNHPLDNGMIPYEKHIESWIGLLGLEDRVVYLDGGDGKLLMDSCEGVVVVNSTMGLEAMIAGRPVYCLGQAVYAMPGLAVTTQDCLLDDFWKSPIHADEGLVNTFLKVLSHGALVRGNFYTDEGISVAIEGVMSRLGANLKG